MSNEFLDYIEDILDAMQKAELLVKDVTYNEFAEDFRINFAIIRALEIIGEATKRLPGTVREAYPDIPWREMAGMRDRMIHGYDTVDLRIVWDTVQNRLPEARSQIERVRKDYAD
jgi:uncharacterized protein with HEPN domain